MTWTAYRGPIVESDTGAEFTIAFVSDDGRKHQKAFPAPVITDDLIKQTARNEIARLNAVVEGKGKVTIGQGEVIDVSLPMAKEPTAEEVADAERLALRSELRALKADERDGLRVDAERVAALQARLS